MIKPWPLVLLVTGAVACTPGHGQAARPAHACSASAAYWQSHDATDVQQVGEGGPPSFRRVVGYRVLDADGKAVNHRTRDRRMSTFELVAGPGASGLAEDDLVVAFDEAGTAHYLGCVTLLDREGAITDLPVADPAPGLPLAVVVAPIAVDGKPYISTGRLNVVPLPGSDGRAPVVTPPQSGAALAVRLYPELRSSASVRLFASPNTPCRKSCLSVAITALDLGVQAGHVTAQEAFARTVSPPFGQTLDLPAPAPGRGLRVLLTLTGSPKAGYWATSRWHSQ